MHDEFEKQQAERKAELERLEKSMQNEKEARIRAEE